ncbi:MAG: hypothetical protein H7338_16735 [Candidatus Sericytochromatia bacterium]|nr:hypothetical protein [Candidatus Sericytochromatia bacterium]
MRFVRVQATAASRTTGQIWLTLTAPSLLNDKQTVNTLKVGSVLTVSAAYPWVDEKPPAIFPGVDMTGAYDGFGLKGFARQ